LLLEDTSGRIKILRNEVIDPANFVTGVAIALRGKMNPNGFFETSEYTYPGIPSIECMPKGYEKLVTREDSKEPMPIFEDLEDREFVAFVSGLEFGNKTEKMTIELLAKWILGHYGTPDERMLSSKVSRIIIGGNSIGEEADIDEVIKGSFRTHDINEKVYANISHSIEQFESFLEKI
jgi:DNA polymerase delta subunit 2